MPYKPDAEPRIANIDTSGDPKLYKEDKTYREQVDSRIIDYLQKDWFGDARILAQNVGMSESEFERMAESNKPNPWLIA